MLLLDVLERLMPSALTDPVSYTVRWTAHFGQSEELSFTQFYI